MFDSNARQNNYSSIPKERKAVLETNLCEKLASMLKVEQATVHNASLWSASVNLRAIRTRLQFRLNPGLRQRKNFAMI